MPKTRSVTRNQNHVSASRSSRNRLKLKTCGISPWSELYHDVLFVIMMKLDVVDFVAFSGVCKAWRSFAVSNWNTFMAAKPPMTIHVSVPDLTHTRTCYLEEIGGRKYKTSIPTFFGVSCGYLVFFGKRRRNFWLVNPITRHKLQFPDFPADIAKPVKGDLVFSPSVSKWVFAVMYEGSNNGIWIYIMGKGKWIHVPSTAEVIDLHDICPKKQTPTWSF